MPARERPSRVRELAEATPADRERSVDLLRAAAILLVVLGHWLVVVVESRNGGLTGGNLLGLWPPGELLTWGFQVMPIFFLVGGYANAASWTSARRDDVGALAWLDGRARRLLRPTTVFLLLGVAGAAVARLAGADPDLVETAGWLVVIALWFLAVYLALVALTPLVVRAVERFGLRAPLALGALAAVVDLLSLAGGLSAIGLLNFALVWLCLYALGVAWRNGNLLAVRGLAPALAGGGLVLLVTLVTVGTHPVSMVNVPGADVHNTSPPSLALLALGLTQTGLALLARPLLDRLARRSAVWIATVAVNGTILSIYLWHLVPVVVAGLLLYGTGAIPQPPPASPAWFALRPVWILACAALLALIVPAVARFERVPKTARPVPTTPVRLALAALGVVACCAGLVLLTRNGLSGDGPAGIPIIGLVPYAAGLAALTAATRWRVGGPPTRRR